MEGSWLLHSDYIVILFQSSLVAILQITSLVGTEEDRAPFSDTSSPD